MKGIHQQSSLLNALAKNNLLSPEIAETINSEFSGQDKPFIRFLVEEKKLNSKTVAAILSRSFGYPLIDLSKFDASLVPEGVRNEKLIRKHNALPLYLRGKVLFVAMSDPTDIDALEDIQFNTGFSTELVLVDESSLQKSIDDVLESDVEALDISDIDSNELAGIEVQEEQSDNENCWAGAR